MDEEQPYNPLDKRNLGFSVAEALLLRDPVAMGDLRSFAGAGVYAIYYVGNHPAYAPLTALHAKTPYARPIYVGKSVPPGARKGGFGLGAAAGNALFNRLRQHRASIEEANDLNVADFFCRYLVVDDIWIPLGESLLIEMFQPVWNKVIDGFGNHDPGKGRYRQKRSPWDTLHPGRKWAERCPANPKQAAEFARESESFLKDSADYCKIQM